MKKIYLNILLFTLSTFSATVHAEQGAEKFLDAIVEVRITVPENARTAERFGTNRVASGVVIDKTGHILTIPEAPLRVQAISAQAAVPVILHPLDRRPGRRDTVHDLQGPIARRRRRPVRRPASARATCGRTR